MSDCLVTRNMISLWLTKDPSSILVYAALVTDECNGRDSEMANCGVAFSPELLAGHTGEVITTQLYFDESLLESMK